jgi:amidophosphoribosyltransferase
MRAQLIPCLFEYVYFARPDSTIDGTSVYAARLAMGEILADKIRAEMDINDIDVVMPIPDTSRPSAMQLAAALGLPYREGFIKNRYIGRTFIMPGQETRKKSVRQKLTPMPSEFKGKNVLLVDDSIVRGTTSQEIVALARESGALKVYFASAAPAVRYPNVYGIDMPTRTELIAHNRNAADVSRQITADKVIYQDLDELEASVRAISGGHLTQFDASCFNGKYVTGDIDAAYLDALESGRAVAKAQETLVVSDDEQ